MESGDKIFLEQVFKKKKKVLYVLIIPKNIFKSKLEELRCSLLDFDSIQSSWFFITSC